MMSKSIKETFKALGEMTEIYADLRIVRELVEICEDQILYRILPAETMKENKLYNHMTEKLKGLHLIQDVNDEVDAIQIIETILCDWTKYSLIPTTFTALADIAEIQGVGEINIPDKTYGFIFNPVFEEYAIPTRQNTIGNLLDAVLDRMKDAGATQSYIADVQAVYQDATDENIKELLNILDVYSQEGD